MNPGFWKVGAVSYFEMEIPLEQDGRR